MYWDGQSQKKCLTSSQRLNRQVKNHTTSANCDPNEESKHCFVVVFTVQARLVQGTSFVHETMSPYKTLEELWDGEI